jgi:Flp pilus assembly protein TadG
MVAARPVSRIRRRRSAGNALIEGAFTILPTFALIFAFIDFGLMLFRWTTLQNAVREGARYAITYQTALDSGGNPTNTNQDDAIKAVVQRYAMGLVKTTDSPAHIFVNYYDAQDPATANLTAPVGSGGNVPGNVVEVSVKNVSFSWLAPLSGSFGWGIPFTRSTTPLTLNVYGYNIMGGLPAGVTNVSR